MSVEDLSETLLQIKVRASLAGLQKNERLCDCSFGVLLQAFRMQQESQAGLPFLGAEKKTADPRWDLATLRASHAETVLELQKSRQLLLLEHRIGRDLRVRKRAVTQYTFVRRRKKNGQK